MGPLKGKWRRHSYILMQAHDCGTRALRFTQSLLLNHQTPQQSPQIASIGRAQHSQKQEHAITGIFHLVERAGIFTLVTLILRVSFSLRRHATTPVHHKSKIKIFYPFPHDFPALLKMEMDTSHHRLRTRNREDINEHTTSTRSDNTRIFS